MTTGVYVARDVEGTVLYVGSSGDVDSRVVHQKKTQPWWCDVVSVEVTPTDTRPMAYHLERQLIADLRPTRNQMSTSGAKRISKCSGPVIKPHTEALARLIEGHGSVAKLAAAVGCDHMTMSNVWRGVTFPSSKLVARLLAYAGLAFDHLFYIEDADASEQESA